MSASAARESGGHAGARHVAKGVASGFGCQEPLKRAGFGAAHGEAADVDRIGKGLGQCDTHGSEGGGAGGHAALGPKPCSQNGQLQRGPC